MIEDQVRVIFNEVFREYHKAVERHVSDDYKIDVEKVTEAFDANTCNRWNSRIGFHLKMVENLISREMCQILLRLSSQDRRAIVLQLVEENYGDGLSNFPTSNIVHQLYQPFHKKLEESCKLLGSLGPRLHDQLS